MTRAGGPPLLPAGLTASIVLLRHGESTYIVEGRFQGRADPPLSPLGERQAALAADRLASPGRPPALPITPTAPVEIVHSPLRRAAATARAVGAAIGAPGGEGRPVTIRADPDLTEIGQGEWEGRTRADIEARDLERLNAWRRDATSAVAPGGERIVEAAERARTGLERIVANLRSVADPDPGSILRPLVEGYSGATGFAMPWSLVVAHDGILKVVVITLLGLPLDRFWSFPFALCGVSVIESRGGRAILRAHNLVDHLAVLEPAGAAEAAAGSGGNAKDRGGAL